MNSRTESLILSHPNGQRVAAALHVPQREKSSSTIPAVLICHGLGGNRIGKHRLYFLLAQQLAAKGIGCMRLDFRGAGESDGIFTDMTIETQVNDAILALEYLRECPFINSNCIALCGSSLGGAIALLAAAKSKKAASLALWAPFFSAEPWKERWQWLCSAIHPSRRDLTEELVFDGQIGHWRLYEQLFSLQLEKTLDELNEVPILHIHGALDTLIPYAQVGLWYDQRQKAVCETRMISLPHTDHNFTYPPDRKILLDTTENWFLETLGAAQE